MYSNCGAGAALACDRGLGGGQSGMLAFGGLVGEAPPLLGTVGVHLPAYGLLIPIEELHIHIAHASYIRSSFTLLKHGRCRIVVQGVVLKLNGVDFKIDSKFLLQLFSFLQLDLYTGLT